MSAAGWRVRKPSRSRLIYRELPLGGGLARSLLPLPSGRESQLSESQTVSRGSTGGRHKRSTAHGVFRVLQILNQPGAGDP